MGRQFTPTGKDHILYEIGKPVRAIFLLYRTGMFLCAIPGQYDHQRCQD
ncbi:hypothetical protein [Flavisolibacter nicotianae]|nr:hypothetical protein [Flavisolibacter nicotianae]